MVTTTTAYEAMALQKKWQRYELRDGEMVEKPTMSIGHGRFGSRLVAMIGNQVDPDQIDYRYNWTRLRYGENNYFIPDVTVFDATSAEMEEKSERDLEAIREPILFVAEIWSPSTGGYDIETKLPIYRERGDREVWWINPFERTVTIWRRQDDGSYLRVDVTGGTITLHALPHVSVDLDALWPKRG